LHRVTRKTYIARGILKEFFPSRRRHRTNV
jgi:hypothetical protein